MTKIRNLTAILATALTLTAPSVQAQDFSNMVWGEVLTGWRDSDGTHMAALRLSLAPGWKTFWRSPGDAGIPPRFEMGESENVAGLRPVWPRPEVFHTNGMRSVGYAREVVLPIVVTPQNGDEVMRLSGSVEIGICSDVCVPASVAIEAELPPGGSSDARIVAALVDVPFNEQEAGVQRVECSIAPVQYGLGLRAEISMPSLDGREAVVIETADPMIWVAEPRAWWEGDVLIAETELAHVEERGFDVAPQDVRITVIAAGQAVDIQGCTSD